MNENIYLERIAEAIESRNILEEKKIEVLYKIKDELQEIRGML